MGAGALLSLEPASNSVDIVDWTAHNRSELEKMLDSEGALLFRGFELQSPGLFEKFCRANANWLDDFALFESLKKENDDAPWNQWPVKQKMREVELINNLKIKYKGEILKSKLFQFIFFKQWNELKVYCNNFC